jgi:hypothetical protein
MLLDGLLKPIRVGRQMSSGGFDVSAKDTGDEIHYKGGANQHCFNGSHFDLDFTAINR